MDKSVVLREISPYVHQNHVDKQETLKTYVQAVLLEEASHDDVLMTAYRVVDQIRPSFRSKDPRGHVITPHCKAPEATKNSLKTRHIKVKVWLRFNRVNVIRKSSTNNTNKFWVSHFVQDL